LTYFSDGDVMDGRHVNHEEAGQVVPAMPLSGDEEEKPLSKVFLDKGKPPHPPTLSMIRLNRATHVRSSGKRWINLKNITIKLDPLQIMAIKKLSTMKSIPYQTLIRPWFAEGLKNEVDSVLK
jgi:hypothetical protein